VEINNENALLFEWNNGHLDTIATPYRDELSTLWTQALERSHGTDEKLRAAWAQGTAPAGADMLVNGDFSRRSREVGGGTARRNDSQGRLSPTALCSS
jgi:hypothetical protein